MDDQLHKAVEVSERFADGSATERELRAARDAAEPRGSRNYSLDSPDVQLNTTVALAWATTLEKPIDTVLYVTCWPMPLAGHLGPADMAEALICEIIRDIFGNPFHPITLDPSWLTSTVTTLARQMYESRDFSAMPILADALQDAGCDNEEVLNHCRAGTVHVLGCWLVDLVLEKG